MKHFKQIQTDHLAQLPNFQKIDSSLFRGGQPTIQGLGILKENGIKTIINLREEPHSIAEENIAAKELDLEFISIPLRPFDVPKDQNIELFLSSASQKNLQPCFVHCLHGMDRTGLMVGLYRMKFFDWSYDDCFEEMVELGFHTAFTNLTATLEKYARAWGKL